VCGPNAWLIILIRHSQPTYFKAFVKALESATVMVLRPAGVLPLTCSQLLCTQMLLARFQRPSWLSWLSIWPRGAGTSQGGAGHQIRFGPQGTPAWQVEAYCGPVIMKGLSVNDEIEPNLCSVHHISLDVACARVVAKDRGALLDKCDVVGAFLTITVHPDDRWLLGM